MPHPFSSSFSLPSSSVSFAKRLALGVAVSALALGACGKPMAQGSAEEPKAATSPNIRHCHEERPTGSNIGRTVCRSDENIDGSREASRDFLTRKRPSPTAGDGVPNTGGAYGGTPASAPGPR